MLPMFHELGLAFGLSLPGFIQGKLIALAMAAIPVGAISFALYQFLKRHSAAIDAIENPMLHRAMVLAVATILTTVFTALNVPITCTPEVNCLAELDQEKVDLVVKAALGWLTALILHKGKGSSKRK